jgi:hypothetical protein
LQRTWSIAVAYSKTRKRALQAGYRSGLEEDTAIFLRARSIEFTYEEQKITWLDMKYRKYTPDFVLANGIIVETKGRFVSADRRKHQEIKKQHPDLDIRFVFSRSATTISKKSKTTYGMWSDKHGFPFADKLIPESWINE